MDKLSILVHIPQRVVHGIAVTIEVLGQVRHLDKRIRSEETTQSRVIQASVHIYQAKLLKVLMPICSHDQGTTLPPALKGCKRDSCLPTEYIIRMCRRIFPVILLRGHTTIRIIRNDITSIYHPK